MKEPFLFSLSGFLLGMFFIPGQIPLWLIILLPFVFFPLYWPCPETTLEKRGFSGFDGKRSPIRSFSLGWLFGTVESLTSLWWVIPTLRHFGHLPLLLSFLALFLLSSYLGIFSGFFQLGLDLWKKSHLSGSPVLLALWGACLWVVMEVLRSEMFTGFPLNPLGDLIWGQNYLVGLASVIGTTGLSFCILFLSGLQASIFRGASFNRNESRSNIRHRSPMIALLATLLIWILAGETPAEKILNQNDPQVRLGIIQGNIPQDQKWTFPFLRKTLSIYHDLSEKAMKEGARILIWPETAIPVVLTAPPRSLSRDLRDALSLPLPLVTGTLGISHQPDYGYAFSNDAIIKSPTGDVTGTYSKIHLVPFGEYIPFPSLFGWLRNLTGVTGDILPGKKQTLFTPFIAENAQSPEAASTLRIGPVICYEAMYPSLVRHLAQKGANLFVVLTDDAWYGKTAASHQLYQQTMMRAIENGIPMVRAANTGYSGAISGEGHLLATSRRFTEESIVLNIPLDSHRTFYRSHGEWVFRLSLLIVFFLLAILSMDPHNGRTKV